MLWNKKFLTTDHHLWMDLIYRRRLVTQGECQHNTCQCGSKLHSPIAQCDTYLRGTETGSMQGTLINCTLRAHDVDCVVAKKKHDERLGEQ